MYRSLCLCEASTSVRCIQTDLLREREELVWRGGRLSEEGRPLIEKDRDPDR